MREGRHQTARWIALLAVGALMVHQLRFEAGYGAHAHDALQAQGHSYLPLAEVLVALLLLVAVVRFIGSLGGALRGRLPNEPKPAFGRSWALSSAALTAIYCAQEGLEGGLSPGHPAGLLGIFGHGGWTAVLLALIFGAAIAALLHVAHTIAHGVRRPVWASTREWAPWDRILPRPFALSLDVLARNLAARAPPSLA